MAYIRLSYPYNTFLTIGKEKTLTTPPLKGKTAVKIWSLPLLAGGEGKGGA